MSDPVLQNNFQDMGTHLSPSDWWQSPGQVWGECVYRVLCQTMTCGCPQPALYLKSAVSTDHTKHVTAGRPVGRNLH